MCRIRVARKNEGYLPSTMADCVNKEVILKEPKYFKKPNKIRSFLFSLLRKDASEYKGILTEEIIEEIINHELIHIIIAESEGDIVSSALDNISAWLKNNGKFKLVFTIGEEIAFQM